MLINGPKIPKILFIKGVFKKDCITDDIFDRKIIENASVLDNITSLSNEDAIATASFVNYKKLPPIFENIDTWCKSTNLLCWNCTLNFDSIPVFIPGVIEPCHKAKTNENQDDAKNNQQFSISVHGVFCSFGCAKTYVDTHNYSISDKIETHSKLKLLYKIFYNKKMKDIPSYPALTQMKQFGGDLSIVEFKDLIRKYNF